MNEDIGAYLEQNLERLKYVTRGCRVDMHEPDEQGITAALSEGNGSFDNAGGCEMGVWVERDGDRHEWFNLATLIALARLAAI